MPKGDVARDGGPRAEEIRAALEHMAGSEAFRGSPQLVSFLRYVVEATLQGTSDRIKGYTIAVEALGRAEDFDPQADPIVRVEAMRLRRALARYYENGGKRDPVQIDLPLGSYVPAFRRNALDLPPCDDAVVPLPSLRPALPSEAATPPAQPAAPRRLRRLAAAAALLLAGAAIYAGLDFCFGSNSAGPHLALEVSSLRAGGLARPKSPFPMVYIGRFEAEGGGDAARAVAGQLRSKLRDALARFDELTIMRGAPPAEAHAIATASDEPSRYELSASVDTDGTGTISVALLLSDVADGRIAFARTFQHGAIGEPNGAEEAVVRDIATTLAQPYGIIHARERVAQMSAPAGDPRYRCLLASYDYWRTYSATQHAAVRDCLERVTEADPSFAAGFAALAEIILQEHRHKLNIRPGDAPPLERAMRAARRAVELKPGSAYAYQALMDVHFRRGEHALALEAGEKAVTLNPYHPNMLGCYGARLVALGQVEKGTRYLREAADALSVRPAWLEFYLFLASYMLNDQREAALHSAQIMSDTFPLGHVAHALVAAQAGKPQQARDDLATLAVLQPSWRDDPVGAARKFFPSDAVARRVAGDIAQISGSLGQ
jgi:tetratricopeptide (TPR) repeat protein